MHDPNILCMQGTVYMYAAASCVHVYECQFCTCVKYRTYNYNCIVCNEFCTVVKSNHSLSHTSTAISYNACLPTAHASSFAVSSLDA